MKEETESLIVSVKQSERSACVFLLLFLYFPLKDLIKANR